jgi:hypothetical protein
MDNERVTARIERDFTEEEGHTVAKLLETLDIPEADRLSLAILDISEGKLNLVRHHVEVAKMDYRDVLLWAEQGGFGDYLGSPSS